MEPAYKPLISIALSTYNGEKYLRQQLDSLLLQTYEPLEMIVVDDCSTDSTFSILQEYEKKDSRIRVFANEENKNFNKSFEKAFLLCKGEYIAISDQDDIWEPNKIEILFKNIHNNLLIYSNSCLIDENGNEIGRNKFRDMRPAKNDPRLFSIRNTVSGHTILFKKTLLDIALPIPPHCYYDWWFALVAANEKGLTNVDLPLTRHRIHGKNTSQSESISKSDRYESMYHWISSVLTLKNLRYRPFFERLHYLLGIKNPKKRDSLLIVFQLWNNHLIYNKKDFISRINSARKIVLSNMPKI